MSPSMADDTRKRQPAADDDLMPSDEDLLYEEELLRNPYNIKMWCRYLQARADAPAKRRFLLYERAIRALPGSYKVLRTLIRSMRCLSGCMVCVMMNHATCSYLAALVRLSA